VSPPLEVIGARRFLQVEVLHVQGEDLRGPGRGFLEDPPQGPFAQRDVVYLGWGRNTSETCHTPAASTSQARTGVVGGGEDVRRLEETTTRTLRLFHRW
jgi:hypothetical protein